MSATQELFQSLRSAFATDADPVWLWIVLAALLVLLLLAGWFGRAWSRKKARRELLQTIAAAGADWGVGDDDVGFVVAMAERAGLSPVDVMKYLTAFERASAHELALSVHGPRAAHAAAGGRIHHLRVALGFDVLPPDHWLTTTRELKPPETLQSGALALEVVAVDEISLTLETDAAQVPALGPGPLLLEVIRPHDARYNIRGRILESFAAEAPARPGRHHLVLAHDENPRRVQQREFVRVRVARPMSYVTLDAAKTGTLPIAGQLIDVSAGGLAFQAAKSQAVGALHRCSFDLGAGEAFKDLATIVLDSVPIAGGTGFHIRVAFTGLALADRARLTAAVAWHEQHGEHA